jgi:hypothetical protein
MEAEVKVMRYAAEAREMIRKMEVCGQTNWRNETDQRGRERG